MDIRPSPSQEALIRQAVEAGWFERPEDAVKEALGLWEERECTRAEFRETLDEAETSLAHGEGTEITRQSPRKLTEASWNASAPAWPRSIKRPAKWHTTSADAPRRTWKISPITLPGKAAVWKPPGA